MFKVFLFVVLGLLGWVLYNTYFSTQQVRSQHAMIQQGNMQGIIYRKSYCPFCHKAKNLLDKHSIPYQEIDLENNPDVYKQLVERTGQKTVPYIYIDSVFIGGFDDLVKFLKKEGI